MNKQELFNIRLSSGKMVRLQEGTTLSAEDLFDLASKVADNAFAEVNQNPTDPTVLGLKNLSLQAWTVTLVDGSRRQVDPGRSLKLAPDTVINFGSVSGTIRETATGYVVVGAPGLAVSLKVGQRLTAGVLFGLSGKGPVAAVSRHPNDPNVLGMKNLSNSPWIAEVPGSGQRQIASGKTLRLTAGTMINFGFSKGEIQRSVPVSNLGDDKPYFNAALANPPPRSTASPSGQNPKTWEFDWQDLRPYLFSGGIVLVYTLLTKNFIAPVITIGLAWLLRQFGAELDNILAPIWPYRDKIPRQFRTILAWVAPVSIAYVITGSATLFNLFSRIPFVGPDASVFTCMTIIGTLLMYLLIREPQNHQMP